MQCQPFRKFIIRHTCCCRFFNTTLLHLYRCLQTAAKACSCSREKKGRRKEK